MHSSNDQLSRYMEVHSDTAHQVEMLNKDMESEYLRCNEQHGSKFEHTHCNQLYSGTYVDYEIVKIPLRSLNSPAKL